MEQRRRAAQRPLRREPSYSRRWSNSTAWSVSRPFATTGSFRYYCELHGAQGGIGMSGTVTVNAAQARNAPRRRYARPILADRVAPKLALAGRRSQRVLKQRGLTFTVKSDEPATLRVRGSVNVPGAGKNLRFRSVGRSSRQGSSTRVKLRLSRRALRSVRGALRRELPPLRAGDPERRGQNGKVDTAKRRIRLR